MIRDFRLLIRPIPPDGQVALPLTLVDDLNHVITRLLGGTVWSFASHGPYYVVNFSTYNSVGTVRSRLDVLMTEHSCSWVFSYENRQEHYGWTLGESQEWFRLFKTASGDR